MPLLSRFKVPLNSFCQILLDALTLRIKSGQLVLCIRITFSGSKFYFIKV